MNNIVPIRPDQADAFNSESAIDFVTMKVADQLFGIPVLLVRDVLGIQSLTRIPLASPEIAGVLNLRGRVITAIDLRCRLGMEPLEGDEHPMSIVVENAGELYSLVVDSVGEVIPLSKDTYKDTPATVNPRWRSFCKGVYGLRGELLIALDIDELLDIKK
jgi:purine-binding chemotaxis protein CheW